MIGCLTGTVIDHSDENLLLDVNGVGYIVYCSERTMAAVPQDGSIVRIYTDLFVREDMMLLFGFLTRKECELHKLLTSVQGVGAKAALAVAGALGADATIQAITLKDSDSIRLAKGVGPKIAQRVVNELHEKIFQLLAWSEGEVNLPQTGKQPVHDALTQSNSNKRKAVEPIAAIEAHSALINLGYQQGEAARAVAEVTRDNPKINTEELIRECLIKLQPS